MRQFVSENNMKTFEQEVGGVLQKQTNTYLPEQLIDEAWAQQEITRCDSSKREPVYVAVDPPSHDVSNFGVAAIIYGARGEYIVLGGAEISAQRCEVIQIQATVGEFVKQLRKHPWVRSRVIIPIIECNNNGLLAQSILTVFRAYEPIVMPFVDRYFSECITDQVGVRTHEQNKV